MLERQAQASGTELDGIVKATGTVYELPIQISHRPLRVEDVATVFEHQNVGDVAAKPTGLALTPLYEKVDAGLANSINANSAIRRVNTEARGSVSNLREVRDGGHDPQGGHAIDEGTTHSGAARWRSRK